MYNRLFTKILDSSIWLEADTTRLVWITFLATMDEEGYAAFSSIENLSRRANIPLEETKQAVLVLEAPDKFNPNDEFDGRRIERVDNGWLVLKGPFYRGLLSREVQREQTRLRVAKFREKKKLVTSQTLPNVTNVTGVTVTTTEQNKTEQSKTEQVPVVGFDKEIFAELFSILSDEEERKNGGLWMKRIRENSKAVRFAIEDYKVRTPYQRGQIRNKGGWMTDRYKRALKEIEGSKQ